MASSEKKRPLIEENTNETVSSIPSRPPLKKRFTSSMNVQQVTSQANTLPAIHTPTTAATATTTAATTAATTATTAIATSSTSTSDTPMEPLGRIDKFPMANIEFSVKLVSISTFIYSCTNLYCRLILLLLQKKLY